MTIFRKRPLVDRDAMNFAPRKQTAEATADIYDRINSYPKAVQLLATACSFVLLCEVAGINAQDTMTAAKNLMFDPTTSERRVPQFQAMKYHLREELEAGR